MIASKLKSEKENYVYEVRRVPFTNNQASSIDKLIKDICRSYGVGEKEILAKCRQEYIVMVRNIVFYNLRYKENLSLPTIGRLFNKHHATVMHGIAMVKSRYLIEAKKFMK